jgi:hypothetical protein
MMEPLLNSGRTLFTDNFYTSVNLAHSHLEKQTHLVGTLRARRKCNPKTVVIRKLAKGEMCVAESNTKVIVGKWRDKRGSFFNNKICTKSSDSPDNTRYSRETQHHPGLQ